MNESPGWVTGLAIFLWATRRISHERLAELRFDIPAQRWFRGALRPMMEEVLNPSAVRATGLFDAEAIERIKRDHLARRANLGYPLWGLLTLFLWMKRWKIESSAAR